MASTLSHLRPVPAPQRANGSISGTYTAATEANSNNGAVIASGVLTITPGFMPKSVKVINVTARISHEWFQGMLTGDYLKTVAAGTRSLETDDALVVNATTGVVTVLATGDVLDDNATIVWEIKG